MRHNDSLSEIEAPSQAPAAEKTGVTTPPHAIKHGINVAANLMRGAVHVIDLVHGQGYAVTHPELVAAFMQSAVFAMGPSNDAILAASKEICLMLERVATTLWMSMEGNK